MAKTAVKVYWDRKKLVDRRGHGAVEFQVYLGKGERKFYSIALATPMEWMRLKNNKDFLREVEKYESIIEEMRKNGEAMTIANLDSHLEVLDMVANARKGGNKKQDGLDLSYSFIEYVREIQEEEDCAKGTMKHKRVVLRSLEEFGRIQTFEDLTPSNIMAYDRWLHKGDRTDVTCYQYHKYVHYYINMLLMEERIPSDPYNKVKIRKGESKERQPLTEEELIRVRDAKIEREKLDRVRDLFIFMAYTGLSYIDTQSFDFKKMTVYDETSGLYFIDGRRLKTKTKFFTPILPPAQAVLEKHDYRLLKMSNQKVNDHLHTIEELLDIKHPMTCHIGRHSFATLCLAHGAGMENVSRMLGHTNLKTTMRYAKILQSSIKAQTASLVGTLL